MCEHLIQPRPPLLPSGLMVVKRAGDCFIEIIRCWRRLVGGRIDRQCSALHACVLSLIR